MGMEQENSGQAIPKVIHYVWVGGKPLSPLGEKCLASWRKYLPDYEIKRWDETNSPMNHPYVQKMYKAKKWAFVADYIRFFVLTREGGIYLDTDTEALKGFNDLLKYPAFFGQTKDGMTAAGVIGAVPNHPAILAMLGEYDKEETLNTVRTSPMVVTDVLKSGNYKDVQVFDYRYFNPLDEGEKATAEKLAIAYTNNHWAESWQLFPGLRKFARKIGVMPLLQCVKKVLK